MRPFYYCVSTNFGDHMNSWIWHDVAAELVADETDGMRLVGIGSLLSRNLDLLEGRKVVFGSGSGYNSPPTSEQAANWKIYCVRGPLSARLLGLDPSTAITDAAWLVNLSPRFGGLSKERAGTVFVPHWSTAGYGDWKPACDLARIRYVNPLDPCETVFGAIAGAELAIVESLHGAIMADYYRTPWIAVSTQRRVLTFKWIDWCRSLDLEYRPFVLPPSDLVDRLLQGIRSGRVSTKLHALAPSGDDITVVRTMAPPKQVNAAYRARTKARKVVRQARARSLEALMQVRNHVAPGWNARHREALATYFDELRRQAPCLSTDAVRQDRIERLNERLDRMRRDYAQGTI